MPWVSNLQVETEDAARKVAHLGLGVGIGVLLGVGARSSPVRVLGIGLSGGLVLLGLAAAAAAVGLPRLGFASVGEVGGRSGRRVGAGVHLGGGHSRRRRGHEEGETRAGSGRGEAVGRLACVLVICFAFPLFPALLVGRAKPNGTNWALTWPTREQGSRPARCL